MGNKIGITSAGTKLFFNIGVYLYCRFKTADNIYFLFDGIKNCFAIYFRRKFSRKNSFNDIVINTYTQFWAIVIKEFYYIKMRPRVFRPAAFWPIVLLSIAYVAYETFNEFGEKG